MKLSRIIGVAGTAFAALVLAGAANFASAVTAPPNPTPKPGTAAPAPAPPNVSPKPPVFGAPPHVDPRH